MNVRIAIVAESFPPDVNGVAHCTLRVAELIGHYTAVLDSYGTAERQRDDDVRGTR